MGFMSVLSFAHKLISERLTLGDRAIDATVGTGADTLFLAKTTGARGEVYGFDIQAAALKLAEERLRLTRRTLPHSLPLPYWNAAMPKWQKPSRLTGQAPLVL